VVTQDGSTWARNSLAEQAADGFTAANDTTLDDSIRLKVDCHPT